MDRLGVPPDYIARMKQEQALVIRNLMLGFISLIFVYILRLLRVLDSPFRASGAGLDDVSLYQIDAIHRSMIERLGGAERSGHQH